MNKVIDAAAQHHVSLWLVLEEPLAYGLNIHKGMHTKLQGFRDMVESFIVEVPKKNAYELGAIIVRQSGIMTVSYTHLDVYKRQEEKLRASVFAKIVWRLQITCPSLYHIL